MGFFTKDAEPSVLELHDLDALVKDGGVAKPTPLSKAPQFTVVPMAASEELEIVLQLCVWCFAALSPIGSLVWLVWSRCSLLSVLFALAVAAASAYPHPIRVCDPTRLSNPIRNMKAAAAFIRYFSFRMVVEDLDSLTKLEGAKLFAGVPHGLWPVGEVGCRARRHSSPSCLITTVKWLSRIPSGYPIRRARPVERFGIRGTIPLSRDASS